MKDTKSEGQNKDKFYASFKNRRPGSSAPWIEVTVLATDRQEAKELAKAELIALPSYTFVELD